VKDFTVAVVKFQEEARLCLTAVELQLQKVLGWLERDRPSFWKREIEKCYAQISEARVRLHQCQMRRHGDFKPTCYQEKKDLERAKKALEFSQKQVPVVRAWNATAHQEANEYFGRASQLTHVIEHDLPKLLALLHHSIDRLEAYGDVASPARPQHNSTDTGTSPVADTSPVTDSNNLDAADAGNSTESGVHSNPSQPTNQKPENTDEKV
jgi:hypothetical protein